MSPRDKIAMDWVIAEQRRRGFIPAASPENLEEPPSSPRGRRGNQEKAILRKMRTGPPNRTSLCVFGSSSQ